MNHGRGLRNIREVTGLSTSEFAEKCGLTAGDIFKIEENCEKASKVEVQKICKNLNIPREAYAMLCLDLEDVSPEKRFLFEIIAPTVNDFLLNLVDKKDDDVIDNDVIQPLIDKLKEILNKN